MSKDFTIDDSFNLQKIRIQQAGTNSPLRYVCSTYDPDDQIIRDGFYEGGRKVVSFANMLKHDTLPLAETLDKVLKVGQQEMGRPVEIEFAVNIRVSRKPSFSYCKSVRL